MEIGNKMIQLRKRDNLSQEDLAQKVGVTRQTISKWELGETSPDISQAKKIANVFHISLDELVCNDISNILINKVSNTEKLAGIIIKMLKYIGIGIVCFIIFFIFLIIFFSISNRNDRNIYGKDVITCYLDNEEYVYEIEYNKNYEVINTGGDAFIANHVDTTKYDDVNQLMAHIEDYFSEHNGKCNIKR